MKNLLIKNKVGGVNYLVGKLESDDNDFWCIWETNDKDQAVRKVRLAQRTSPESKWVIVKQTTTFDQVYLPETEHGTI